MKFNGYQFFKNINFNIIPILLLSLAYGVKSQELDPKYLETAPDEIKDQIIEEFEKEQNSQDSGKNYDSFNSNIKKKDQSKKDYKQYLNRFGDIFFNNVPSTFMPINDPSANSGYILDVDDEIKIFMIGDRSDSYTFKIDRSGDIYISDVGRINVAGLSISQANALINDELKKYFVDTQAILSLSSVRDIQILITGSVEYPGIYTLNGYTNILQALISAGGISKHGSMRNIIINRQDGKKIKLDLYKILIDADMSFNISLRSGDSILVNTTQNLVPIIGGIARPALYEFKKGETVQDIIKYAGGATQESINSDIILSRVVNEEVISIIDPETSLQINDRVFVPYRNFDPNYMLISNQESFIEIPVEISGAVNKPGSYFIRENSKLSSIIDMAGGYSDNAYIFAGILTNEEAKKKEEEYNLRLYNEALKLLSSEAIISKNINTSSFISLLDELRNIEPSGRIVAEFNYDFIKNYPSQDTMLSPGDKIFIPYKKDVIHVFGEVLNPGTVKYSPSYKVKDYINISGGYTNLANKRNIIVVKANGEAYKVKSLRNIFSQADPDIQPGAVIYVTRDLQDLNSLEMAASIAPIFSSLAISLASINSINRNN